MTINMRQVKPAAPWAATLATLMKFEKEITSGEHHAMEARWHFGRELLNKRAEYKARMVIPKDLMKLAMEQCARSNWEIRTRIRFAERFTTKKEMRDASLIYPSWRQMVSVGLVDNTKKKTPSKKKPASHAGPWVIGRLRQEVTRAFATHQTLTREQVKDIELLRAALDAILKQIDQNDIAKEEKRA